MYKRSFAFLVFLTVFTNAIAQKSGGLLDRIATSEDRNVLFRNEATFGAYVHSAIGIGFSARRGYHVTGTRKRMFECDIANYRSLKEVKQTSIYNPTSGKNYVLGKVNSVLLVRGGYGYQSTLYKKSTVKNVEINYITFVGVTAAFVKPVYLEITSQINGNRVIDTKKYDPALHDRSNIYGRSSFSASLNKLKVLPAGYLKVGLNFDFIDAYNKIKAIETGFVMDVYPIPIEMMVFSKNKNVLMSVYLKMNWGVKWF
jgi:hypothetical protein